MDTYAKLQGYFYEEEAFSSRSIVRKFPKVHKIVKYILNEMSNKGVLYTDIEPLTRKYNNVINNPNIDKSETVRLPKTSIDNKNIIDIIIDLYNSKYIDKPFSKILVMDIKEEDIDVLNNNLTFVIIPEYALHKDEKAMAFYDYEFNSVVFFLPGMEAARSTKQVQQLISRLDRESNIETLYHELTHFVQNSLSSRKLFTRIIYLTHKYVGIDIRKKYENRLDEIEAFSFGAVLYYLQNKNIKQFIKDTHKKSFPYRVINYDENMKDIYKKMSKSSQRKTVKLIKSFAKSISKDKQLLRDIFQAGDMSHTSSKFVDRLIKVLEEQYGIVLKRE